MGPTGKKKPKEAVIGQKENDRSQWRGKEFLSPIFAGNTEFHDDFSKDTGRGGCWVLVETDGKSGKLLL